jgi:hypothetical protein
LLDVDAAVSPRFEPGEKIQPVVVVGDGDRPGMGGVRGRRFWAGGGAVLAAGQGVMFRLDASAPAPIQLDRLALGVSAGSRVQIQLHVGAAGGVTNSNSFLDRASGIEAVPGLFMLVPAAGTGTVIGQYAAGTAGISINLDILLNPNLGIGIHMVSAITADCWLMGRSF